MCGDTLRALTSFGDRVPTGFSAVLFVSVCCLAHPLTVLVQEGDLKQALLWGVALMMLLAQRGQKINLESQRWPGDAFAAQT